MASTFPGAIDSFTDPLSNSALNSPSHSAQHADLNSAVNKVETYMGLVKVIPTGATGGTVGATGTVTVSAAQSAVTVSGCFSSLYNAYKVIISGGTASTGNVLNLQLVQSGGTVLTSGYYEVFIYSAYSGSTVSAANGNNISYFQRVGGVIDTSAVYGSFELINPFAATNTIYQNSPRADAAGGNAGNSTGQQSSLVSCTGFKLLVSAGTISGSAITVYGYRI